MSKDERKFDSFAEIPKDKEEDMSILETLLRAPAGSNVQNQLERGSVGDASSEPSPDLIHRASGPRNSICSDVGAEGGQNVVRSSENVQQQKPTSNKRDISKTNDSLSSIRNKKMRNCEINLNESCCQPLDLSIRGASCKTDMTSGGESSSSQKIKINTSTSSKECSGAAFISYKKSSDQRKKHVCVDCRKEFSFLSKLKIHMRVHTRERPYECNVCQKAFNYNSNLKDHMRVHTGDRPYVCKTCQKAFTQSSNLATHMIIHTGEQPYSCEICQQTFTQLSNLNHHMAIHSGRKPYPCDYCDFVIAHKN